MRTLISSLILLFAVITASAQNEQRATTTGAIRLFSDKDDLTSVITIIPSGTTVEVIKPDTVYTLVNFDNSLGYVKSDKLKDEVLVTSPATGYQAASVTQPQYQPQTQTQNYQSSDRYSVLIARYGQDIGKRLYQHKVWKGVTADMARDSWGKPKQINRMYVDQSVDEEWVYSKKFLYFRDNILIEWGPVK